MIVILNTAREYNLLPIVMLTVGVNFNQEPVFRPDGANFHQIFYVEKGHGVLETNDQRFELSPGTAVFMREGYPMNYYSVDEVFESAWIAFVGNGVDKILDYLGAENLAFLNSETIYSRIANAYKLAERRASSEVLSKCAYDILVSFFNELNSAQKSSVLLLAKDYIEEHYAEDISVSDIASALGISESLVFRLFRDGEKSTPSAFLRSVRLSHAQQILLSESECKIGNLARRCGFLDAAYFCKVFKAETGMTPRNYRSRFMQ